jgi:hypothetical protein
MCYGPLSSPGFHQAQNHDPVPIVLPHALPMQNSLLCLSLRLFRASVHIRQVLYSHRKSKCRDSRQIADPLGVLDYRTDPRGGICSMRITLRVWAKPHNRRRSEQAKRNLQRRYPELPGSLFLCYGGISKIPPAPIPDRILCRAEPRDRCFRTWKPSNTGQVGGPGTSWLDPS